MTVATPTQSGIPLRLGNFKTLTDALDYAATGQTGINIYASNGRLNDSLPYSQLRIQAQDMAKHLVTLAPKNTLIGIIAQTSVNFVRTFFACQYAGLVPVPMPMPTTMGGKETYLHQIRQMCETAKVSAMFAPERLLEMLTDPLADLGIPLLNMNAPDLPAPASNIRPHSHDDLCYIQYSSGSTNDPKGVIGSQQSVTANCNGIIKHGLEVRPGDRAVSWLPLYHDMGLIGFMIAPMMSQLSLDLMAPSDFARRPLTWLDLISRNKGTLSYSPSFGFELCVKRWRGDKRFDLSSWRAAGIGGDMVRADALSAFAETFGPHGFSAASFVPSYGMAEATLAIAFAPLDKGATPDIIDNERLRRTGDAMPASDLTQDADKRTFMLCGKVLPDHRLEVRDENGRPLDNRKVGRIFVQGPSITPGYYLNQDATQATISEDGWLETGDLGYLVDGQIVITGRSKDLILAHGRNIWPQDLEWAVEGAVTARIGRTAAFPVESENGADEIVLLVECRSRNLENLIQLHAEASAAARLAANASVRIGLVPLSSLIVTSSGKISRARARQKFVGGGFEDLIAQTDHSTRHSSGAGLDSR